MKSSIVFSSLAVAALLFGLSACSQRLNLGAPGDVRLDDLTAQEAAEACDSYKAYYDDEIPVDERLRVSCTRHGVKEASDRGKLSLEELRRVCAEERDSCLNRSDERDVRLGDSCDFNKGSCQATIDELEPCLEAIVDETAYEYAYFECETITSDDARPRVDEDRLEACYGIQKSCYDD